MTAFIEKNYRILLGILVICMIVCSYFIGKNEAVGKGSPVVLSCDPSILSSLMISPRSTTEETLAQNTEGTTDTTLLAATAAVSSSKGMYVGSKNGTKYYTPGCSGTSRIKPENIIWFSSREDAEIQGYSRGSC